MAKRKYERERDTKKEKSREIEGERGRNFGSHFLIKTSTQSKRRSVCVCVWVCLPGSLCLFSLSSSCRLSVCLCWSYPSFHFPLSLSHVQGKIRIQPAVETEALSVCVSISVCVCVVDVFWDAGLCESKNALVPAETLAVTPRLHLLLIHTLLCQATRSLSLCSDGCGGEGKS